MKLRRKAVKKPNEPDNTKIGELLVTKMQENGIDLRTLAQRLDITYEHARRLVRGEGLPSKYVLTFIAKEFKLPLKELTLLTKEDQIRKRYGTDVLELSGHDPTMEPMERIWPKLTTAQQAVLVDTAKSMVRRGSEDGV